MRTRKPHHAVMAAALALAVLPAACGGRSDGSVGSGSSAGGIGANCPGNTTTGVTDSEIVIGTTHPESGPAALFAKITPGIQAYFNYANAELNGVKGRKIRYITRDDGYQSGRAVQNVNEMVQSDKVFGFFNNVGTAVNLAIWDQLQQQCIPNIQVASGASQLNDPVGHPFTLLGNPPYAIEPPIFVDYLKQQKPGGAKVAILYQNDDFGRDYLTSLKKAVQDTGITLAGQASYEPTDPSLTSQMTTLAASKPDAVFLGATGINCPRAVDATRDRGFQFIYLSDTCTTNLIIGLANPAASNGVLSSLYFMEANDPGFANNQNMQLFKTKGKQYLPSLNTNDSLAAYGWSQAAVFVDVMNQAPQLNRVSVMETFRAQNMTNPPGLYRPGIPWHTSSNDSFPIETLYLGKYDPNAQHFVQVGDNPYDYEGKAADFAG